MSLLFRSYSSSKQENIFKQTLLNNLKENAREIQFHMKTSINGVNNEGTNSLCTTLEAIFLHELKDSFINQTINALSGDTERKPAPSFWTPMLVFMHKQVIEQIQGHIQITSEIGYCRSWVRSSLNESLFSSYLNNIRKNNSALNPYYKRNAFLRDLDCIEIASKIIEGVESCVHFNLPLNSSLLNQWPNYTLQLAGLWTIPLKSCPITSGVDVVSSISEDVCIPSPKPLQTNEVFSESISNSPFSRFGINDSTDDENLNAFSQTQIEKKEICESSTSKSNNEEHDQKCHLIEPKEDSNSAKCLNEQTIEDRNVSEKFCHGNSLSNLMYTSWSSELIDENLSSNNPANSDSSLRSPIDQCSYNSLLKKHEKHRQVDWTNIWAQFFGLQENENEKYESTDLQTNENTNNFEALTLTVAEKVGIDELQDMVKTVLKLSRELGLDSQGFLCKSCAHPLGIGFSQAQVCAFTGNYYCDLCMDVKPVSIPARIMCNWDFHRYPVSKKATIFLEEIQCHPFINIKTFNPDIYQASEEMAELQALRIQLNFIRAYLYTCCSSSIEELKRLVSMKSYLFEHIHQYSIEDLNLIRQGTLYDQLLKAVNYGEQHILNCVVCSVKGFICEICKSPKVLYPFHIEKTYRCEPCGAVFHAHCLNEQQPCPKCQRKRKRQDLKQFQIGDEP